MRESALSDLNALARATEVLVSPLAWSSRDAWVLESLRQVRDLLGAEASVLMGPGLADRGVASPDLPASIISRLENVVAFPGNELHWSDDVLDEAYAIRRSNPTRVYTMQDLRASLGSRLEESPIYQSVIEPSGLLSSVSIGVMVGELETVLSVMARGTEGLALGPGAIAGLAVLRGALAAGLGTLHRLRAWQATLGATLDQLGVGLFVYTVDGCHVLRNQRAGHYLAEEPERTRLLRAIDSLARRCSEPLRDELARKGSKIDFEERLHLVGGDYRLRGSRAAAGTVIGKPAVLVMVERLGSILPSPSELAERCDLSHREAEVALLVAEGLSNGAIAKRLQLSHHTIRHHLERVFEHLGVHSRQDLAWRLIRSASP